MSKRVMGLTLADSGSLVLALLGASVASLVIGVGLTGWTDRQTLWLGEAVASLVAAAVWMVIGRRLAPPAPSAAIVLFVCGVAAVWFLSRGIVHSISPYYGLASIAAAHGGASVTWAALARDARDRWRSVAVPITALVLIGSWQLATPSFGVTRTLWEPDGSERVVHVTSANGIPYMWTEAPLTESGRIRIELDPGSGASEYRSQRVVDAATRTLVCDRFAQDTRTRIAAEVKSGAIPSAVTRLPFRTADCADGQLWALTHP
ncbi:MAG: hypothetical protein IT353_17130 [Gemmatimonadaceae bacterium]|nr:hypothetical protein [Gemmatimonadaceae bacterium]